MFQKSLLSSVVISSPQHSLDLGGHHHLVKRLGNKVIPPICMAITIFMLSEAEEIKITGTLEIFRISWHQ